MKGVPKIVQKMKIGVDLGNVINVNVDSDWAKCGRTGKSTNGGCILMNGACLNTWSTTQAVTARASGDPGIVLLSKIQGWDHASIYEIIT